MKISSVFAAAGFIAVSCVSALAQQITGVPGSPSATVTIDGKQLPPPAMPIRRGDQGEGFGVEALVAAARGPTEGRAQRAAHYDG